MIPVWIRTQDAYRNSLEGELLRSLDGPNQFPFDSELHTCVVGDRRAQLVHALLGGLINEPGRISPEQSGFVRGPDSAGISHCLPKSNSPRSRGAKPQARIA